MISGMKELS